MTKKFQQIIVLKCEMKKSRMCARFVIIINKGASFFYKASEI